MYTYTHLDTDPRAKKPIFRPLKATLFHIKWKTIKSDAHSSLNNYAASLSLALISRRFSQLISFAQRREEKNSIPNEISHFLISLWAEARPSLFLVHTAQ
jgi:hypothetical protein